MFFSKHLSIESLLGGPARLGGDSATAYSATPPVSRFVNDLTESLSQPFGLGFKFYLTAFALFRLGKRERTGVAGRSWE
ncbi:MAG: hypothetical protein R6V40_02190 [Candidatus Moraniibacteriota bacterium]